MRENVNVQYVGFEAKALVREYRFLVRQASVETREFAVTIVNEAFSSHRVRYQDGPDVCSLRLHRVLATFSNHLPRAHYRISELDLNEYRDSHAPNTASGFHSPKVTKQL